MSFLADAQSTWIRCLNRAAGGRSIRHMTGPPETAGKNTRQPDRLEVVWDQADGLRPLITDATVAIALLDLDFRYVFVNRALAIDHGLDAEAHVGRHVSEVVPHIWPTLEKLFERVLAGETIIDSDIREPFPKTVEQPRRYLTSLYPVRSNDQIVGIGVMVHDVTALWLAEEALRAQTRLYMMLSRTNRAVSHCATREELYRQVCETAVEVGDFRFAWVGVPYANTVRVAAFAGMDNGYLDELQADGLMISTDPADPRSRGPMGHAILKGIRTVVNDFSTSPMTGPWREAAERAGIRASAAFPIRERGRVAAVLSLHSEVADFFTPDLVDALGELTPALSSSLDRFALEEDRASREAALALRNRALQAAAQGVVITDATAFDNPVIFANPAFERITGYGSEEILGRNCRILQGPDTDPSAVAELHLHLEAREACTVELLNYRRDGTPFMNRLAISPLFDEYGALTHFVGYQTEIG